MKMMRNTILKRLLALLCIASPLSLAVAGDVDLAPLRSGEEYEALMKKWRAASIP